MIIPLIMASMVGGALVHKAIVTRREAKTDLKVTATLDLKAGDKANAITLAAGQNFQIDCPEGAHWAAPPVTAHSPNVSLAPQTTPLTPLIGHYAGGTGAGTLTVNWIAGDSTTINTTEITIAEPGVAVPAAPAAAK